MSDESARGWLYGIARNVVRRYHRRGRVELATCRKLGLQLAHDPGELEYDQAAALMGTSEPNARVRVSRALKTLSIRLGVSP